MFIEKNVKRSIQDASSPTKWEKQLASDKFFAKKAFMQFACSVVTLKIFQI